jgi:hypothetical protein
MTGPSFVDPREVVALKRRLHGAFVMLLGAELGAKSPATVRARELLDLVHAWNAYLARPVDWVNAPDELEHGFDLEARLAMLEGAGQPVRTGEQPTGSPSSTTMPIVVTPGDVLAYRKLWDSYVMGIARAALQAAGAWDAVAKGQLPAMEPTHFPWWPNRSVAATYADLERASSETIETLWNQFAGLSDLDIVVRAEGILRSFQDTVLQVGQYNAPRIAKEFPQLPLPEPPNFDLQAEVIGHIEGLGILAKGVLHLLGIGASGALETTLGAGKRLVETVTSPVPWVAAGGILALLLLAAIRR